MHKLVKKNLAAFVTEALSSYQKARETMHVAVISALFNTATSGDVTLLNRIYEGLGSNDQTALRLYVRRASIVNGLVMSNGPADIEALDTETMTKMVKLGAIVDFKKGKFSLIQNQNSDAAKSFATVLESRLLNPDGKRDKMVFERNNFAEHKTLGDADVLKALLKTANEALNNASDNKTYSISAALKAKLGKIKTMLEVGQQQATLSEG